MARISKKQHQKEIVLRNSSKDISHSIEKIKANEKKYTIILVVFFFLLFCFAGFQILKINNNYILNSEIYNSHAKNEITLSGEAITLTAKDIKNDDKGLISNSIPFTIENFQNNTVHYQIILEEDESMIEDCGCREKLVPITNIRYSLDDKNVHNFSSSNQTAILEDTLVKNGHKDINLKIWLDDNLTSKLKSHFHGHLKIKII